MFNIKDYDSYLYSKKSLDGSIQISRKSPFDTRNFDLFKITNQFYGSGGWLRRKLQRMDNQRIDLAGEAQAHNDRIRNRKTDDRLSKEAGRFIHELGCIITT